MAYTHAAAHNVGAEVGRGGGGASREGEQDFSKFLLCKASLPSQFSIPAPTDYMKMSTIELTTRTEYLSYHLGIISMIAVI